ncbi:hypothetical protein JCM10212_000345 [Sporobolomyces blumeae]
MTLAVVSVVFLASFLASTSSAWSLFPPQRRFTQERLVDAGSLGLPKTGTVAACGDHNADQLVDLFYLAYDQRSLSVWHWDRTRYEFVEDPKTLIKTPSRFVVTNVVPGDFDYDGRLDVLLMGQANPGGGSGGWWGGKGDQEAEMKLYLQQADGSFAEPIDLDPSTVAQPIPFDAAGTMRTSLLGFSPNWITTGTNADDEPKTLLRTRDDKQNAALVMWENVAKPGSANETTVFELADAPLDLSTSPTPGEFTCVSPSPHSNAFVDLTGDCLADLFLVCVREGTQVGDDGLGEDMFYQVWAGTKGAEGTGRGSYKWMRQGDLPRGTKSVGFADMDRDGTIDLVITSCPSNKSKGGDCTISIAYNEQMPLCSEAVGAFNPGPGGAGGGGGSEGGGERCRDPENLCVGDDEFRFDSREDVENPSLTQTRISTLLSGHTLSTRSTSFQGALPTPPQIGDYNIDGYPDLLIVSTPPRSHTSTKLASLLQSVPCTVERGCTDEQVKRKRRTFKVVDEGVEELSKFKDVESVAWFDMDDDGSLDIVVQRSGNSGAARQVHFIKNNYFNDAFFLKASLLNGACRGWCEPQEPGQSRYRPYGSSYSGASFKFTVLDPSGARRSTQYGQLSQTSYLSLQLPYAYLGLGRTNNYVENLFIGSTRHQPLHYVNLEGVIPNSQVFILPWQSNDDPFVSRPDGPERRGADESGDPSEWRKELYLKPGDWIPWVTVVLLTAIVLLGIVVVVLHLNEKREDEVERRARLLSLNFQAL